VGREYREVAPLCLNLPSVPNVLYSVATHMLGLILDKIAKMMAMIKYVSNALFITETDENHR